MRAANHAKMLADEQAIKDYDSAMAAQEELVCIVAVIGVIAVVIFGIVWFQLKAYFSHW